MALPSGLPCFPKEPVPAVSRTCMFQSSLLPSFPAQEEYSNTDHSGGAHLLQTQHTQTCRALYKTTQGSPPSKEPISCSPNLRSSPCCRSSPSSASLSYPPSHPPLAAWVDRELLGGQCGRLPNSESSALGAGLAPPAQRCYFE